MLHGPGGTGKTELAKAFGRWWRDTGGVELPDWVIWHSFEPGVASFGLDGVVAAIGLRVFGADFARLDPPERRSVVHDLLAKRRLLLIWDNFESVHTMPDPTGATPPLDDDERAELRAFLDRVAAGAVSAVIITSRTPEEWLGDVRRIKVRGLDPGRGDRVRRQAARAVPGRARRAGQRRDFAELMEWLDGHPLSMRLVLPHVDTTDPRSLLAGLQGTVALPGSDDGGRTTSLAASVAYSFDHLDPTAQRALVAVSLFHGVTDAVVLGALSQVPGVPEHFRGLAAEDWAGMLKRAAGVGLLSPLGAGMYRIHPALPAYLVSRWRGDEPSSYDTQRAACDQALLAAYAAFGNWLQREIDEGDAEHATAVIGQQRRTLGALLGYALDNGLWRRAQAIAQPLNDYWNTRGLVEEARGWVDRARLALEAADGTPPPPDTEAGALWLFLVVAQANREVDAHSLDQAERTYREILEIRWHQSESPQQRKALAVAYHQLGMVAQTRGQYDVAEDWYRKSLALKEDLTDRPGIARTLFQLGVAALERGRYEAAEDWFRNALTIFEQIGNQPAIARCHYQLGRLAQDQGRLDAAEGWFRQALTVFEQRGALPNVANSYHVLGSIGLSRGLLDVAEDWYRRSLTINEKIRRKPEVAMTYHMLGIVAQMRRRFDDAEDWYRKSLAIKEALGNRPGMSPTFGQLGVLAAERGRPAEALAWIVRCVTLFDEFPHPATGPARKHLARLTAELGMDALERCWHEVTGDPLPQAVRDYLNAERTSE